MTVQSFQGQGVTGWWETKPEWQQGPKGLRAAGRAMGFILHEVEAVDNFEQRGTFI